jgi:hypothetical protein
VYGDNKNITKKNPEAQLLARGSMNRSESRED